MLFLGFLLLACFLQFLYQVDQVGIVKHKMQVFFEFYFGVMLFFVRVGDAEAATETLMDVIALSETEWVLDGFRATGGLIRKPFHIDDSHRLKDKLELTGALVEFIRPDEVGNAGE